MKVWSFAQFKNVTAFLQKPLVWRWFFSLVAIVALVCVLFLPQNKAPRSQVAKAEININAQTAPMGTSAFARIKKNFDRIARSKKPRLLVFNSTNETAEMIVRQGFQEQIKSLKNDDEIAFSGTLVTKDGSNVSLSLYDGTELLVKPLSKIQVEFQRHGDGLDIRLTVILGGLDISIENQLAESTTPEILRSFEVFQNGELLWSPNRPSTVSKLNANMQTERRVPVVQIAKGAPHSKEFASKPVEELQLIESETALALNSDLTQELSATNHVDPIEKRDSDFNLLNSTLTNDDIRNQIKTQAGGFQRCYLAMTHRVAGARELPRGTLKFSLLIESSGKTKDIKLKTNPFNDSLFEQCATDALKRVSFRSFQGAAIPVAEVQVQLE